MLMEMHAHTARHSSCSRIDPVVLVRQAHRKGLQGIILTEHHYLWSADELAELRAQAEVAGYFTILAAQEVDTDHGHVLVYGASRTIGEKMGLQQLRSRYPDAALVWAHPLRNGKIPSKDRLLDPSLDAIEIFSSNHTQLENLHGLSLWHQHKFVAISGSDTHAPDTAAILPTQFDHPVQTMDEVVLEVRSGRCRPFYKEIPRAGSNMEVREIIFGTKGDDESRSRIILKTAEKPGKWAAIAGSSRIAQQVYDHGFSDGAFRVPRTLEINEQEQVIIEEGQRGRNLFDLMIQVSPSMGELYFRLAAKWLAQLHRRRIHPGRIAGVPRRELRRFRSYLDAFSSTNSPYSDDAQRLIEAVEAFEEELWSTKSDTFVLVHGDYHPKNIIIGQDRMHDPATLFISVIDFGSAMLFHRAFDVGYFIAQFKNQFRDYPHIIERHTPADFMRSYDEEYSQEETMEFRRAVNMFVIRANLSIGAFLIKVGKGESEDMRQVMMLSLAMLEGDT